MRNIKVGGRKNMKEQYVSYKYKFIYIATDPFVK